jgi:hypothetical protein
MMKVGDYKRDQLLDLGSNQSLRLLNELDFGKIIFILNFVIYSLMILYKKLIKHYFLLQIRRYDDIFVSHISAHIHGCLIF